MMNKRTIARIFASLAAFSFFSSASAAVLTYTGNTFDQIDAGPGNFSGFIETSGPLVVGQVLTAADIVDYSFTAAGYTINSGDGATFEFFNITIGADLLPASWSIGIELDFLAGAGPEQWTTRGFIAGTIFDAFSVNDTSANSSTATGEYFSAIFNDPGQWSEVSEVPVPAAFGLFAAGLGALGWARRKRDHAKAGPSACG